MKKVILNHESYLLYDEIIKFKKEFESLNYDKIKFIIFPSIQYLNLFNNVDYAVGAQNFYSSNQGAFSGEINLESLKNMKINYTLVGQSQRVNYIYEDKKLIKEKLFKSLNSKFNTLLCIGESKNMNKPYYTLKKEINFYLKEIERNKLKYLSIVYDPKYFMNCIDIDNLKIIYRKLKLYIKSKYNINVDIYYGGLVNYNSVKDLFDVFDGIVLDKLSISINSVKRICNKLEE